MGYKTILVSLNEVGRLPELVAAAAKIAQAQGSHVAGLYVIPAVQVYPSVGFEAAPQVFEGNRPSRTMRRGSARCSRRRCAKPMSSNFVFETYGIFGLGKFENHLPSTIVNFPQTNGKISANLMRYGIQPNFGYKSQNFIVAISSRIHLSITPILRVI